MTIPTRKIAQLHSPAQETDRMRAALDALRDPVIIVDESDRITAINHAGEQVTSAISRDPTGARSHILAAARKAKSGVGREPVPIGLSIDGASRWYEATASVAFGEVIVILRDVTAETAVREVLLESRQRYKNIVELAADVVWECDESGTFSYISEPGAFGFPPNQLVGRQPDQFTIESVGCAPWPNKILTPVRNFAVTVLARSGQNVLLSIDAGPVQDRDSGRRGARGIARVITRDQMATTDVPHTPVGTRSVADAIADIEAKMRVEWQPGDALQACAAATLHTVGAAGCVIFGKIEGDDWIRLAEAGVQPENSVMADVLKRMRVGRAMEIRTLAEGKVVTFAVHWRGQRAGALIAWRGHGMPDWSDNDIGILGGLDVSCGASIRQAVELRRLTLLSRTDGLTGLLNRSAFRFELTGALARANRRNGFGALLYLDLDRFKVLNDACGHEAGNAALAGVGAILSSTIRPYDLAARIGGDEFALWLEDISAHDAGRTARRIARAISEWTPAQPYKAAAIGASLGIAIYHPERPESPDDLIARADRAMYRAKRSVGKSVVTARARRTRPQAINAVH